MKIGVYKTTEAQRAASARYKEKNQDTIRDYLRNHHRDRAAKFKQGLQCIICGESHPAALSFHHREKSDKEFNLSAAMQGQKFSDEHILAEITKCDVLCLNCHAKRHWDEAADGGGTGSRKPRGRYKTGVSDDQSELVS